MASKANVVTTTTQVLADLLGKHFDGPTEVIENTVLGLGRHTAAWFEHAPAPEGDGEVLVIMFDGKGAPTVLGVRAEPPSWQTASPATGSGGTS